MNSLTRSSIVGILIALGVPSFDSIGANLTSRIAPTGSGLSAGDPDINYRVMFGTSGIWAYPVRSDNNPNWVSGDWISPSQDQVNTGSAPGLWTYEIDFSLGGYDAATASLSGTLHVDDSATVYLNGVPKFSTSSNEPYTESGGEPFTITGDFISGNNTLTIEVTNLHSFDNPTGLLIPAAGLSLGAYESYTITVPASGDRVLAAWQFQSRTVSDAFPNPPNGLRFEFHAGGTTYTTITYSGGAWSSPSYTLTPGLGFFVSNPSAGSSSALTFYGDQVNSQNLYLGALVHNHVGFVHPAAGTISSLCYSAQEGDIVYKFDVSTQSYSPIYSYDFGSWGTEPSLAIGEGVVIRPSSARTWTDCF